MIAEIGTPAGLLNSGEMHGQFSAGAVNLEFGCAKVLFLPVFSSISETNSGPFTLEPFHSVASTGGFLSSFSHQTVLSALFRATLVKMVFLRVQASAFGLDFSLVPGATPKKPFSGLIAYSLPSLPGFLQAISSPTVNTL